MMTPDQNAVCEHGRQHTWGPDNTVCAYLQEALKNET